jgi:hypothetical protein
MYNGSTILLCIMKVFVHKQCFWLLNCFVLIVATALP